MAATTSLKVVGSEGWRVWST